MHADIHLQLHALNAAELHHAAGLHRAAGAAGAPAVPAVPSLRVQIGWRLVELGLRLATPAGRPVPLAT